MDNVAPEVRSRLMSRVRGKDTTPEMVVRRLVHSMGYRYRLHGKRIPGKPDLVFGSRKKVVFVHGCFWHRHEGCPKATVPKSNVEFWHGKFDRNIARDARIEGQLRAEGWDVLTIWECETKDRDRFQQTLASFLGPARACPNDDV